MKLQRLLSLVRQAVDDYALIDDQDHIAVGVSGGKGLCWPAGCLAMPLSAVNMM